MGNQPSRSKEPKPFVRQKDFPSNIPSEAKPSSSQLVTKPFFKTFTSLTRPSKPFTGNNIKPKPVTYPVVTNFELPDSFKNWNAAYENHKSDPDHLKLFEERIQLNSTRNDAHNFRLERYRRENEIYTKKESHKPESTIHSISGIDYILKSIRLNDAKYFPLERKPPELTPQILKIIESATRSEPANEALVEIDNTPILRKDIQTLIGLRWLNDEIVNAYLSLIVTRGGNKKVYAFNTFFFPKLRDSGYNSVKRWTRKVDIFSYQHILVPVHLGAHWCLAFIDLTKRTISYYDSLGGHSNSCCDILLDYLRKESVDKKKQDFDDENWRLVDAYDVDNIPRQMNSSDCGVFLCTYAEYLTRHAKLNFSQAQMPYFRKKMIYEIVTKRIMDF